MEKRPLSDAAQRVALWYASEPWGKLILSIPDFPEPYYTDSQARDVARFAADKLEEQDKLLQQCERLLKIYASRDRRSAPLNEEVSRLLVSIDIQRD